ncbi:MAG: hypothetical protein HC886_09895 [Leptolyngbyaceae cyanobacterium SM1_1_3]|nr:hypothetical protein [Leptolyngbyaceae cyanobacterium SM1_1_3]
MSTLNPLLLQTLAASGGNANSSIQEMLLSQLGDQDPTVSLLAKYLTQNQANDEEEEEEEEDDDASIQSTQEAEATYSQELEAAQVRNQKLVNIARQLWQELEDLDSELEDLRDRNDALAQALGACHLCWGED